MLFENMVENDKAIGEETDGARRKHKWRKTEKRLAPLV